MGGTLVDNRASRCAIAWKVAIRQAMTSKRNRLIATLLGIFGAAALRLVPHPPNFSPIDAMALFGGAYLGRRGLAFVAPLGALLLSDLFLRFDGSLPFVYMSVALVVLMGSAIASRKNVVTIGAAALASSVLFFVITNFGAWAFSGFYQHSASGLVACYVAAVPFFQNTLAGDLFYATLLFGGFRVAELLLPQLRARPEGHNAQPA